MSSAANGYSLDLFEKAPAAHESNQLAHDERARDPAGAAAIDDVEAAIAAAELSEPGIKVRIEKFWNGGSQPHDPKHHLPPEIQAAYPSKSELLKRACCALVRANASDRVIYQIITDSKHGVAQSVLEKKNVRGYAERQIERARVAVTKDPSRRRSGNGEDPVAWVNERYFALLEGKRVTYYRDNGDGSLEGMQSAAFDFELAPHVAEVGDGKLAPYSALWRSSKRRRYYPRGFVLDPTNTHQAGAFNLWRGFGVEPRAGDWSTMRAHVEEVLAAGSASHADYILRWAAFSFQNPATPPRVALVFKGGEGVGKGFFCNSLVSAFGVHGMRVQDMRHVAGHFNAHLRHCCLLFADEAIVPGSDVEGALKGMITEPTIPIESKGVDVVQAENHLHVVMSSNNDWVVPAGIGARRFAVFAASSHRKGDSTYFARLYTERDGGGLAAMVHDLLALDLSGWHPEAARPDTDALADQKAQSLDPVSRAWFDCLQGGELPPYSRDVGAGIHVVSTRAFAEFTRRQTRRTDVTENQVAAFFGARLGLRKRADKPRGYESLSLADARRRWDDRMFRAAWGDEAEWESADEDSVESAIPAIPF